MSIEGLKGAFVFERVGEKGGGGLLVVHFRRA